MEPIVRRFPGVGRVALILTDDRETNSADTDDADLALEFDGRVVAAAAFDVARLSELRDAISELIGRDLPPIA